MTNEEHMRRLIERLICEGHLYPLFVEKSAECKYINDQLCFFDLATDEWAPWEKVAVIEGDYAPLFKASNFLLRHGWYENRRRHHWIHVLDIQDKCPVVDCITTFQGALYLQSILNMKARSKRFQTTLKFKQNYDLSPSQAVFNIHFTTSPEYPPEYTCSDPATSDET